MYDNDGLNKIQKSLDAATGILNDGYKARLMAHAIEAVNAARLEGFEKGKSIFAKDSEQAKSAIPAQHETEKIVYTDGLQDLMKDVQKVWNVIKVVLKD